MRTSLPWLMLVALAGCSEPSIDVMMDGDAALDADTSAEVADAGTTVPKALFTLTVTKTGAGQGTVYGTAGGTTHVSCGTDCSQLFLLPTTVTLTASPSSGTSRFAGWSGACTGTATTCTVTVGPAGVDVTARFDLLPRTLTVGRSGNGLGTITGTVSGSNVITCQGTGTCSTTLPHGTIVTLRATPNADARFAGWTGACTGTAATCTLNMQAARSVRAQFIKTVRLEIVVKTYDAGGRVRSTPARVMCDGGGANSINVCTYTYDAGTSLSLDLLASRYGRFDSGPCEGDFAIEAIVRCPMTLSQSRRIDVSFSDLHWE